MGRISKKKKSLTPWIDMVGDLHCNLELWDGINYAFVRR
jgi:hypothetical protein